MISNKNASFWTALVFLVLSLPSGQLLAQAESPPANESSVAGLADARDQIERIAGELEIDRELSGEELSDRIKALT